MKPGFHKLGARVAAHPRRVIGAWAGGRDRYGLRFFIRLAQQFGGTGAAPYCNAPSTDDGFLMTFGLSMDYKLFLLFACRAVEWYPGRG